MSVLNPIAEQVAQSRYYLKDDNGNIIENWESLSQRVVNHVCQNEKDEEYKKEMLDLISQTKFLPNSPCLVNAGRGSKSQGLLACFVTKAPEDSWLGMLENIANYGHIARQGGGCGVSFSKIRPEGDPVFGSTHAKACGPIEHMRMISEVMSSITQSGFRGMACLPYESMVCTEEGYIPIGDIVKDQRIGLGLHTQFGNAEITKAWSNGNKEVFEIITERGHRIKLTGDHLVYVIDSYNGKNHGKLAKKINKIGQWKKVQDLDLSCDSLVVNLDEKPFSNKYQYVNGIKMDEELASLISYVKCDGTFNKRKDDQSYYLSLTLDSEESVDYFTNNKFGDLEIDTKPYNKGSVTFLQKTGKKVEFLSNFGEYGTYHCDIPASVFSSPKTVVSSFLKSAFDAEGTVDVSDNRCRIILGMTSLKFVEGIQTLLNMFGIQSSLRRNVTHVNKDGITRRGMHYLSISNKWHVKEFMQQIGFMSNNKNSAAAKALNELNFSSGRGNVKSKKIIHKISSISSLGEQEVFDISTTNETFIADGFVVHNCMGTLMVNHPDVKKFIVCKQKERALRTMLKEDIGNHFEILIQNPGDQLNIILDKFIHNFNISVVATDEFMNKVKNNEEFDLTFNGRVYETVKAKEIFDMIVKNAWNNGDPGLLFYNAMNSSPYKYSKQEITATNPCVAAGSLVATEHGWRPVEDVQEGDLIWSRNALYPVKTKEVNHNCELYRVEFTDGDYIDVTASHRFKCVVSKKYEYRRLDELCEGSKVLVESIPLHKTVVYPVQNIPSLADLDVLSTKHGICYNLISDFKEQNHNHARNLGLIIGTVIGDGSFTESVNRYNVKVAFGHAENVWQSRFQQLLDDYCIKNGLEKGDSCNRIYSNALGHLLETFGLKRNKAPNKIIPDSIMKSNDIDLLTGLLDGLFSTDGNMYLKKDNPMLRFSNSSEELCKQIRRILLGFGIHAKIYKTDRKQHIYQDPRYGPREISAENPKYDVVIMNDGINKFHNHITLSNPDKENKIKKCVETYHYQGPSWTTAIRSITKLDGKHTVYDLYNEETDEWNVNGYVQQGCGEQQLPEYGSCNLGSIDVSKFHNDSGVQWKALSKAIKSCVRFLDNTIDVNKWPTPEFEKWAVENRPVGLGIMGYADLLLQIGIEYGSEESIDFANKLGKFFQDNAHEASVELAKEKGTPKCCKFDELDHRRNITTLSIAPTGTIAILAGCSNSIEPIYSPVIYRKDNTGFKEMRHPFAKKRFFKCAVSPANESFPEVTWQEHVTTQAVFQKYVDSAISKTINMSNSAKEEDIADAFMMAWENGCKGITIYRDGSKSTQVLNTSNDSVPVGSTQAPQRPRELPCDIHETTADGFKWHILVGLYNDNPYELFAVNGKVGLPENGRIIKRKKRHYSLLSEEGEILIENLADEEAEIDPKIDLETRRFSLELRHGVPPKYIVQQIDKSNSTLTSFSKATARIMKKKYMTQEDHLSIVDDTSCPECRNKGRTTNMICESGCWRCPNPECGFALCG